MVEPQPSKLMTRVRFPSPAPRGPVFVGVFGVDCPFGSVVEHSLGKGEVAGPIPAKGTSFLHDRWRAGRGGCAVIFVGFTHYFSESDNGKRKIHTYQASRQCGHDWPR